MLATPTKRKTTRTTLSTLPLKKIILVRHAQSLFNTRELDPADVGDHNIPLTPLGTEQALQAGRRIGSEAFERSLVYCSPYLRTRQTLDGLIAGAGVPRRAVDPLEDPRLREVEHGYGSLDAQEVLRRVHGSFWYRYDGGESPADVYDRLSTFLDSFWRQVRRKGAETALVVTHGIVIRCFIMRFFHLTVDQFNQIACPVNCEVVTVAPKDELDRPAFTSGKWGVSGILAKAD